MTTSAGEALCRKAHSGSSSRVPRRRSVGQRHPTHPPAVFWIAAMMPLCPRRSAILCPMASSVRTVASLRPPCS